MRETIGDRETLLKLANTIVADVDVNSVAREGLELSRVFDLQMEKRERIACYLLDMVNEVEKNEDRISEMKTRFANKQKSDTINRQIQARIAGLKPDDLVFIISKTTGERLNVKYKNVPKDEEFFFFTDEYDAPVSLLET